MKQITFWGVKGGTGKTLLSTEIYSLFKNKNSIVFNDADPQQSATMHFAQSNEAINTVKNIDDMKFDQITISDLGGHDNNLNREILSKSDLIILPLICTYADMTVF
jgi:cellulose biosynthesis protein BcsQ